MLQYSSRKFLVNTIFSDKKDIYLHLYAFLRSWQLKKKFFVEVAFTFHAKYDTSF